MTFVVRVFVSVTLDVASPVGNVFPPFDAASSAAFIEPQPVSMGNQIKQKVKKSASVEDSRTIPLRFFMRILRYLCDSQRFFRILQEIFTILLEVIKDHLVLLKRNWDFLKPIEHWETCFSFLYNVLP